MKLFLILAFSITSLNPTSTNTNLEQKIAIVESDITDGNYIQFIDNTAGWWLEADAEYPNFEEGQILKLTIDTKGALELEDDELIEIESLGFVE